MRLLNTLPRALPRAALPKSTPQVTRRHASSSQSLPRRFLSTSLLLGGTVAFVSYYYDSRSLIHEHVVMPIVRLYDPETGHKLAIRILGGPWWLRPKDRGVDGPELKAEVRLALREAMGDLVPSAS
jgi:dihydroorotate dehydrogenase